MSVSRATPLSESAYYLGQRYRQDYTTRKGKGCVCRTESRCSDTELKKILIMPRTKPVECINKEVNKTRSGT